MGVPNAPKRDEALLVVMSTHVSAATSRKAAPKQHPSFRLTLGLRRTLRGGGGELPSGRTIACLQQDVRVMEKVLILGLDINGTTTDKGLSPLHLATQNDNEELFMMLLEHGASP
jgi:hypothetical protein